MTYQPDNSTRCDRHTREVFPPRCTDCDQAEIQAAAKATESRLHTADNTQQETS